MPYLPSSADTVCMACLVSLRVFFKMQTGAENFPSVIITALKSFRKCCCILCWTSTIFYVEVTFPAQFCSVDPGSGCPEVSGAKCSDGSAQKAALAKMGSVLLAARRNWACYNGSWGWTEVLNYLLPCQAFEKQVLHSLLVSRMEGTESSNRLTNACVVFPSASSPALSFPPS